MKRFSLLSVLREQQGMSLTRQTSLVSFLSPSAASADHLPNSRSSDHHLVATVAPTTAESASLMSSSSTHSHNSGAAATTAPPPPAPAAAALARSERIKAMAMGELVSLLQRSSATNTKPMLESYQRNIAALEKCGALPRRFGGTAPFLALSAKEAMLLLSVCRHHRNQLQDAAEAVFEAFRFAVLERPRGTYTVSDIRATAVAAMKTCSPAVAMRIFLRDVVAFSPTSRLFQQDQGKQENDAAGGMTDSPCATAAITDLRSASRVLESLIVTLGGIGGEPIATTTRPPCSENDDEGNEKNHTSPKEADVDDDGLEQQQQQRQLAVADGLLDTMFEDGDVTPAAQFLELLAQTRELQSMLVDFARIFCGYLFRCRSRGGSNTTASSSDSCTAMMIPPLFAPALSHCLKRDSTLDNAARLLHCIAEYATMVDLHQHQQQNTDVKTPSKGNDAGSEKKHIVDECLEMALLLQNREAAPSSSSCSSTTSTAPLGQLDRHAQVASFLLTAFSTTSVALRFSSQVLDEAAQCLKKEALSTSPAAASASYYATHKPSAASSSSAAATAAATGDDGNDVRVAGGSSSASSAHMATRTAAADASSSHSCSVTLASRAASSAFAVARAVIPARQQKKLDVACASSMATILAAALQLPAALEFSSVAVASFIQEWPILSAAAISPATTQTTQTTTTTSLLISVKHVTNALQMACLSATVMNEEAASLQALSLCASVADRIEEWWNTLHIAQNSKRPSLSSGDAELARAIKHLWRRVHCTETLLRATMQSPGQVDDASCKQNSTSRRLSILEGTESSRNDANGDDAASAATMLETVDALCCLLERSDVQAPPRGKVVSGIATWWSRYGKQNGHNKTSMMMFEAKQQDHHRSSTTSSSSPTFSLMSHRISNMLCEIISQYGDVDPALAGTAATWLCRVYDDDKKSEKLMMMMEVSASVLDLSSSSPTSTNTKKEDASSAAVFFVPWASVVASGAETVADLLANAPQCFFPSSSSSSSSESRVVHLILDTKSASVVMPALMRDLLLRFAGAAAQNDKADSRSSSSKELHFHIISSTSSDTKLADRAVKQALQCANILLPSPSQKIQIVARLTPSGEWWPSHAAAVFHKNENADDEFYSKCKYIDATSMKSSAYSKLASLFDSSSHVVGGSPRAADTGSAAHHHHHQQQQQHNTRRRATTRMGAQHAATTHTRLSRSPALASRQPQPQQQQQRGAQRDATSTTMFGTTGRR